MSRVTASGFESSIVKSWTGWDQPDDLAFQFYDAELTEHGKDLLGVERAHCICFVLDSGVVEIYPDDEDGGPITSKSIRLVGGES